MGNWTATRNGTSTSGTDRAVDSARGARVRFAPSPTGDLHVGNIRTALFNWAYARHTGGTFVFRIEDTDRSRVTEEAAAGAIDTLRWLHLDWDEGPSVGGPFGPYRQSERLSIYDEWARRFVAEGTAYPCYCTPAELEAMREQQRRRGQIPGYDGRCSSLTAEQVAAFEAAGRRPALRMRMPPGSTTVHDLIRGDVTFDHTTIPDFVLVRADGHPLYTLAVAVDDVLMQITHVLRGEDLLASTPRQYAVYAAMHVPTSQYPEFAHLPYVLGQDGHPLSKRHGEVSIAWYRQQGYLPEAMDNYLALLGWSLGDDREIFGLAELAGAFDVTRVNRSQARFDLHKLSAVNAEHIHRLPSHDFTERLARYLGDAGLLADPPTAEEHALVAAAAPLVQVRIEKLSDAVGMLGFLFVDEAHFHVDEQAAAKAFLEGSARVLDTAAKTLADVTHWGAADIETALRSALVDGLGLKPRAAFSPVRVAVTGRQVAPPLFESLELLGRERTLHRLAAARERLDEAG